MGQILEELKKNSEAIEELRKVTKGHTPKKLTNDRDNNNSPETVAMNTINNEIQPYDGTILNENDRLGNQL